MVKDNQLYERLEVSTSATEEEIQKTGKKLLIKWHPDKHPPEKKEFATKKFQEIQEAMTVLTNKDKRHIYDQFGMDGVKGTDGMPEGGFNPFEGFAQAFGGGGFPFPGGFPFGGGGGGEGFPFPGGPMQRNQEKENIIERIDVKLSQIYNEETISVKYNQKNTCSKCNGEGTANGLKSECSDCKGKGVKMRMTRMGPMMAQQLVPCNSCSGKGKIIVENNKCSGCNTLGYITKEKVIQVPLKNGFGNGVKMQLEGKGHNVNGTKTDLILIINEVEDQLFKRHQNDLIIEIELKLYQALFGFDKIINHLDGRKLHLHHSGKTNYGIIRKIVGEGMYDLRTKNKGDLIIKFKFSLPTITNETLIKALTLVDKNENNLEKELIKQSDLIKTIMIDTEEKEFKPQQEEEDSGQKSGECVQQ
jgi:DnaJ-class molecular chaperone